jgi:hypothetical protein
MRVPVCTLTPGAKVEFDPTLYVVVSCSSCGNQFQELASLLDLSPQAEVTAKFQAGRVRVNS